jgi:hypothetical protein
VADPTPAAFTFRVTQPKPEVKHYACDLKIVGAYHDRGTRDWGPCDMSVPCPREAVCLLDLAVDERDDSYLFNYDVHLQHFEDGAYKDRVYCFAPSLKTPVNPKLEVRFDPRRGEYNRHHACHEEGAYGLVDTSKDNLIRYRCSAPATRPSRVRPDDRRGLRGQRAPALRHHRDDPASRDELGAPRRRREPEPARLRAAAGHVLVSGAFGARASAKPALGAGAGDDERGRRRARPAAPQRRRAQAAAKARAERKAHDHLPAGRRSGADLVGDRQAQASGGETRARTRAAARRSAVRSR